MPNCKPLYKTNDELDDENNEVSIMMLLSLIIQISLLMT